MNTKIINLCIGLLAFLAINLHAKVVSIASGSNGSLAFNTGQAIAKVANQKAKIRARTKPLTNYLPLLNNGEIDFGFSNSVEAEFALEGKGNFKGHPNPNLRLVGTMFPLRTGLMVVADTGIKNISDLKVKKDGLRIASEYTASTIIPYYIEGALANGNLKYSDFKMVPVSSFVKGMQAIEDNLVDITLISLNSGAGKKANAKLRNRGGLKYVSLDNSEEGIKKFKAYLPTGDIISLKANKDIPGLSEDANIISIPWVMITHKDVSEELVYKMTKTIVENLTNLQKSFGAFKYADIKNMAPKSKVPYHEGAIKYFKENNIDIKK